MYIEMKLESDFCPASGESIPGLIDIDITTDEFGFPMIPARRIKGCLKEAALEIRDILQEDFNEEAFQLLFGISGEREGLLRIDNGVIKNYRNLRKEVEQLKRDSRFQAFYQKEQITDYYTNVRSQTSINKTSRVALKDSLRSIRVIKKGVIFQIPVELETNNQEVHSLLKDCCTVLRNIGLNRTRGFGEVSCELKSDDEKNTITQDVKIKASRDDICQLTYQLTLQTQLIISQQVSSASHTDTYLSGSSILGVFASEFIKQKDLGEEAHKNEEFRRLFLSNHLKFLNAYPFDGEIIYHPMPLSFVQKKDDEPYFDLAFIEDQQLVEEQQIQTKKLNGYVSFYDNEFEKYSSEIEMEYHHQRPKNRSIGHATKEEGTFFQYSVLKKGQGFYGTIVGGKEDLEKLASLMQNKETIRIGRSKSAQYAKVKLQLERISDYESWSQYSDNQCVITLASPCIIRNPKTGMIEANPINFINEIQKTFPMLSIEKTFVSTTEIGGFNGKWRLPKIQCQALAAGSVFVFKINGDNTEVDYRLLEQESYGIRKNEGFGRIIVNQHGFDSIYLTEPQPKEQIVANPEFTEELLTFAQKMMIRSQIVDRALQHTNRTFNNSFVAKLMRMLEKVTSKEDFETKMYFNNQDSEELSLPKRKKLKPFWDYYKRLNYEQEKKQIPIYSNHYRVLTEECKSYLESWQLAQLFYKTIFQQIKLINRSKTSIGQG